MIDLTTIPAKVTFENIKEVPAKVNEENKFEGQERIALYRVNQYVDLPAGEELALVVTTSEALAFYKAQAVEGRITVTVEAV